MARFFKQSSSTVSSTNSTSRSKSQRFRLRSLARHSTTTTSSRSSSANPTTENLQISDASLLARARSVIAKLDFASLTDMSPVKWTWKRELNEFSLFASTGVSVLEAPEHQHCLRFRRRKTTGVSELLVAGDINCSIEEVAAVLRSETDASFNTAMTDLHGSEFIYGSVVHTTPLPWHTKREKSADAAPEATHAASTASSIKSKRSQSEATRAATNDSSDSNYVAIKAVTFVHSTVFSRNEEWCFLESFECSPSGDSLVVSRSSMPAFELGAGVTPAHAHVVQLHGISTTFLVERIPRTKSVRLMFHAKFDEKESSTDDGSDSERLASARHLDDRPEARVKTVSTRLQKLAKNVSRIPEIVRRRRIGAQTLASKSALAAATNSRCTCCTASLRLLALLGRKQRCHLCAYNVCDHCCSQQMMETCSGHVAKILMCRRCVECVEVCEFAGLSAETRFELRVELDASRTLARKRSAAIKDILETALSSGNATGGGGPSAAAAAATTVIQHMVRQPHDPVYSDDRLSISDLVSTSTSTASTFATTSTSTLALASGSTSPAPVQHTRTAPPVAGATNNSLIAKLDDELERMTSQPLRIVDCVLASAETRSYPIHMPANPRVSVPDYPVPANEAWRLRVIDANSFLALGEVAELNVICALAAETLQCAISMVTIIDQETEHILSCNNPELHRTRMARNQTFCSHLIMDAKPLLIRHPEADVRFHAMDAVTKSGVRFYCGFPLRARDGTVVGSVCCLDFQQRALTQSQYSLMEKLAQTASSVVQTKGSVLSRSLKSGSLPV